MITGKYVNILIAVAMAFAVAASGALLGIAAAENVQVSGIAMEYENRVFGTDVMTLEIEADPDEWQSMLDNATAEEYISCTVVVNGTRFENVGIRPKGNSSLTSVASSDSDRYSFKIKFDKYVDGQTCFGLDKFVVNNIQSDATYMKEYFSYELMNFIGVDTPLYTYADISVNGEQWGFYLAIECYDESFLARTYGDTSGNLYNVKMSMSGRKDAEGEMPELGEGFPPGGDFTPPGDFNNDDSGLSQPTGQDGEPPSLPDGERPPTSENSGTAGSEPEIPQDSAGESSDTSKESSGPSGKGGRGGGGQGGFEFGGGMGGMGASNGGSLTYTDDDSSSYGAIFQNAVFNRTDEEDYQRLIAALKNLSEGTALEETFNVDQIIRYFAAHTVLVNLDSYVSSMQQNYYLYENDGKVTILPWDYNLSFGGFQSGSASAVVNFPIDTPVSGVSVSDRPLLAMILNNEEYSERYHEYLRQIVDGYYNSGLFEANLVKLQATISDYVKNDPSAFYTYEEYEAAVPQLLELCKLRALSIQGQLNGMIPSTSDGQSEDSSSLIPADTVSLSALGTQGGMGGGGDLPGGMGGFNSDSFAEIQEIIGDVTDPDKLTEEQRQQLNDLGITDEMIERFAGMLGSDGMFGRENGGSNERPSPSGDEQAGEENPPDTPTSPDSSGEEEPPGLSGFKEGEFAPPDGMDFDRGGAPPEAGGPFTSE